MLWISKVEMKRKTIFSLVLLLILLKRKDCKGKRESYSKSNLVFYVYERFFCGPFQREYISDEFVFMSKYWQVIIILFIKKFHSVLIVTPSLKYLK